MAEIAFEGPRPRGSTSVLENELWEAVLDPRSGKPRLRVARNFFRPLEQSEINLLCQAFCTWRDFNEYGLLEGEHFKTGEKQWIAIKLSKRGNDVFAGRMRSRLDFLKAGRRHRFFDVSDFRGRNRSRKVRSPVLWTTLTFNSSLCSLQEAWERVGSDFNLWITNLRNRYGRIWYVAFPQAFPGGGEAYGYPHIHLVMLFEDAEFTVFPRFERDKTGKIGLVFRIEEKYQVENQGKWHSFIDIKALSSMRGVLNYCRKYAENVAYGSSEEATLNNAVMWLMRKRSFSLSGRFREAYHDLITTLRNSKIEAGFFIRNLLGELIPVWVWTFLGVFPASEFRFDEDPPPWMTSLSKDEVVSMIDRKEVARR